MKEFIRPEYYRDNPTYTSMNRKRAIEKQIARSKIGLTQEMVEIKDYSKNPGLDYVSNPEVPSRSSL